MPIEKLEQELKNPRLQAALASAWWSAEEAEVILSALERSGLTVYEFAKGTQVGAARLYAQRQQQRKKDAQPKALDVAARHNVNATPKTTNNRCSCKSISTDPAARPSHSPSSKDLFKGHSSQPQPGALARCL